MLPGLHIMLHSIWIVICYMYMHNSVNNSGAWGNIAYCFVIAKPHKWVWQYGGRTSKTSYFKVNLKNEYLNYLETIIFTSTCPLLLRNTILQPVFKWIFKSYFYNLLLKFKHYQQAINLYILKMFRIWTIELSPSRRV